LAKLTQYAYWYSAFTCMTLASAGISCYHVSVHPSVCLSQVSVLLKWLNTGSRKQRHMIAQGLDAKNLSKTQMGSPQRRRQMQVG